MIPRFVSQYITALESCMFLLACLKRVSTRATALRETNCAVNHVREIKYAFVIRFL